MNIMRQSSCLVVNQIKDIAMHNGGSGLRLNDGLEVKAINCWLVPDACLRLGTS